MKLANDGLISITDYIERYIPEFSQKNKVTVRNLLYHTSGLAREPQSFEFIAPKNSYIQYTNDKLLNDIQSVTLLDSKIGKFSYSNYGYIVLGLLAKRAAGYDSFNSLLTEMVLDPLELKDTFFELPNEKQSDICWGHTEEGKRVPPYLDLGEVFSSAGALITSTKELLNICKKLMEAKHLPEAFKLPAEQLFLIDRDNTGQAISFGFHIREKEYGPVYYHPGNIAGHKCAILISPKSGRALAYNTTTLKHIRTVWDLFELH